MDSDKQIDYWRRGAIDDIEAAEALLGGGKVRQALYFAHLALEKMLKAHVVRETADIPPRIHNLSRLAQVSRLSLTPAQDDFLTRFDVFQIEGRYPEELDVEMAPAEARRNLAAAKEMLQWLTAKF